LTIIQKKQKQLGEKFVDELGKLVKKTTDNGAKMKLSEKEVKEVIKTTFVILGKKSMNGNNNEKITL